MEDVRRFQTEITSGGQSSGCQREEGAHPSRMGCVSFGDELYELDDVAAQEKSVEILIDAVAGVVEHCATIVELGAGYGYFLYRLKQRLSGKKFCGADFSKNSVKIAKRIFRRDPDVCFHAFNFYEPATYRFLSEVDPPFVIITRHGIEQVSSAKIVFDALLEYRDAVHSVLHFEPLYRPEERTLLGMLRCRYTESQGYNRDLLPEIRRRREIRVLSEEIDVIGCNPLHPTSIIHWEFVK